MNFYKLAIAALGTALLLSGCSTGASERQAKIQIAAADRQAQVDKAIAKGCKDFHAGKYSVAVSSFGLAARLNPAYLEVARATQFYVSSKKLMSSSTNADLKVQMLNDLILVGGFCGEG